jgi:hypothetical protein
MTILLKQSTSVILKLGPFVDDGDGVTPLAALTIAQADIQISKNGGAFAQTSASSPTTTYDADGWYPIPLTTTDTATLGFLAVQVTMSGALPVWAQGMVVPANVWDSLFSTDKLQVDAVQVEGSDATDVLDALDDATLSAIAALNNLSAAAVNAEVDTALGDYDGPTQAELTAALGALNDPTAAAIADAVWEEDITDHEGTSDSTAEALANAGAAGTPPTAGEVADAVWEEALADHSGTGGSTAEALDASGGGVSAADIADAVWEEALGDHSGTSGSTAEALAGAAASGIAGPGALQRTVGVSDGANPIEGARIWVSTDAAGATVIAGPLVTDSFGVVTLLLDAGTYYAWVRKDGFGPLLGSELEVS